MGARKLRPVEDHEAMVEKSLKRIRIGTPTLDRMVVQELSAKEKTSGGIILPESARQASVRGPRGKPVKGKVVAIGQGMILEDGSVFDVFSLFGIRTGSVVTWHEHGGTDIGDGLHVVSAADTLYVENFGPGEEEEEEPDDSDPGDEAVEDGEDEPELPDDED